MFDKKTQDRFWSFVEKSPDPEGCWIWKGPRLRGYGKFNGGGRTYIAHRLAWELINGEIPPGAELDHTCHNRGCVNPAHLRAVDHRENMREAAQRGVWSGERNGAARRTESQVKIIRCLKAVKIPAGEISQKMKIPLRSVYYAAGEGWQHIEF